MAEKATIFMWLITLPSGEDRIVPLMGGRLSLFWDKDSALNFWAAAEGWSLRAEGGPYPLRLATLEECCHIPVTARTTRRE